MVYMHCLVTTLGLTWQGIQELCSQHFILPVTLQGKRLSHLQNTKALNSSAKS